MTAAAPTQPTGMERAVNFGRRILMSEYLILYLCIAMFVGLYILSPTVATPRNISNLLSNMWPLLVIAVGQTFVLIIAGIDLSQGAVVSLASVVGAAFVAQSAQPIVFSKSPLWGVMLFEDGAILHDSIVGLPVALVAMLVVGAAFVAQSAQPIVFSKSPLWGVMLFEDGAILHDSIVGLPVALVAMLVVGLLIGAFNGIAVAFARIPPFMVTLVTSMFVSALAIYLVKTENIIDLPHEFGVIGDDFALPVLSDLEFFSIAMVIAIGISLVAHYVLSRSIFGRWLYGIGNNPRAALVSGVPVKKVIVATYIFSSVCAAAASIIYTARVDQGRPTLGAPLLLDIIAAVVIGGTSLFGGRGKIMWTVFGVIFLVLLGNALSLLNVPFFYVAIVKGSVILLAALLDVVRRRLALQQV
jgi:ribose/xylose/arabinose/galactoside ABC-type transport system permease subunit